MDRVIDQRPKATLSKMPLYHQLYTDQKTKSNIPLVDKELEFVTEAIEKNCTVREHEIVYALIRSYQIQFDNDTSSHILPYNSKRLKRGIKFNIDNFPLLLQRIIYAFLTVHVNACQ